MSNATDAQPGLPPGRYGSPPKLPRWAAVLLVLVGVAAIVPVAISVVDRASPDARATVTGFDVIDANKVEATVDLHKAEGVDAITCTLRARNVYSEIVGSAEVRLTGAARSGVVVRQFPTSDEAVIVEVTDCVVSDGS